jgi:hypothetical protein
MCNNLGHLGVTRFRVTCLGFLGKPELGLSFITDKCWDFNSEDRFVGGFTRRRVRFRPPTLFTLAYGVDSLNCQVELRSIMSVPLVWDMEDMYGASKRPRQVLGVVNTIKLDDFI